MLPRNRWVWLEDEEEEQQQPKVIESVLTFLFKKYLTADLMICLFRRPATRSLRWSLKSERMGRRSR